VRGCLGFSIVAALLVGLVAWIAPIPATQLALGVVLSGLLASPATVTGEADPPPELLTGRADAVTVGAREVSLADGRVRAGTLAVRLSDVSLVARTALRLEGTLDGVTLGENGLPVERVTLDGSSGTIEAMLLVRTAEAEALVRAALASTEAPATGVAFAAPSSLLLTIGGKVVPTRLEARDGALVAVPSGSVAPAVLLTAARTSPLELTGVRVATEGLVLEGRLPGSVLGL